MMQTKKTILIVDDYPSVVFLLQSIISYQYPGYDVVGVNSLAEGFQLVRTRSVQLAIVDGIFAEEKLDGGDFVRKIRENPTNFQLPIIFYTADKKGRFKALAQRLPYCSYLEKPASVEAILEAIKQALG